LKSSTPELYGEFKELIKVIVLAGTESEMSFEGASALSLFGAILVNSDIEHDPLSMIELLVHESAHNLLHGFTLLAPLHEHMNDTECYSSPLRSDPRPIEGIFHACFVIARMHLALSYLREAESSGYELRSRIECRMDSLRQRFFDGLQTLRRHARLTPAGEQLVSEVDEYMSSYL
jgi:HEXXH motif-containing protein